MSGLDGGFVEKILLSGRAGSRHVVSGGVQLELWKGYAEQTDYPIDILLTPRSSTEAASIARAITRELADVKTPSARRIVPLEGVVAADLTFRDLIRAVLPRTGIDVRNGVRQIVNLLNVTDGVVSLSALLEFEARHRGSLAPELRIALLVLLILAVEEAEGAPLEGGLPRPDSSGKIGGKPPIAQTGTVDWRRLLESLPRNSDNSIYRVSPNRTVHMMGTSAETVKADAARRLFDIDCRGINWAVIDSGIDATHPAFRDHASENYGVRIRHAYDFSTLRSLVAYDVISLATRRTELVNLIVLKLGMTVAEAAKEVARLAAAADAGRPYDWEVLSRLIKVPVDAPPPLDGDRPIGHGTHVAGVLAGDWRDGDEILFQGTCPDLMLYDLRVIGEDSIQSEFAVIAALEFVRWMNNRNRYMTIHGVNLSLGLVHDKLNYACGRTPVCLACEATVNAGVVVVAASGNWGTHSFHTSKGDYDGYASASIADPGNAESVITVGATHRDRPHEYGVSFFSSRGPTGDGRMKPDLVAPGEQIDGPLPDLGFGALDGTSMSAPHVSGAAALLMARNPEFIGKPREIKEVLMRTATDLGRDRHYQGAGLVDALRALQAV